MKQAEMRSLSAVTTADVEKLYAEKADQLHRKIDATREAYSGFIFPVSRADLAAVSDALGLKPDVATAVYKMSKEFSTFKMAGGKFGQLTNHIYGASILALRGKELDTGLQAVSDRNIAELAAANEDVILEIAAARASWFGKIFFPAAAFSDAISVFGGTVSSDALFELATTYRCAAVAGKRKTIRGDFGIALWLTLLGRAP